MSSVISPASRENLNIAHDAIQQAIGYIKVLDMGSARICAKQAMDEIERARMDAGTSLSTHLAEHLQLAVRLLNMVMVDRRAFNEDTLTQAREQITVVCARSWQTAAA